MPQTLMEGGMQLGFLLLLGFLLQVYVKDQTKQRGTLEKLINDTLAKSGAREEKLLNKLDEYNKSLKEISSNIKNIPVMEDRINDIQDDLDIIKEKIGG